MYFLLGYNRLHGTVITTMKSGEKTSQSSLELFAINSTIRNIDLYVPASGISSYGRRSALDAGAVEHFTFHLPDMNILKEFFEVYCFFARDTQELNLVVAREPADHEINERLILECKNLCQNNLDGSHLRCLKIIYAPKNGTQKELVRFQKLRGIATEFKLLCASISSVCRFTKINTEVTLLTKPSIKTLFRVLSPGTRCSFSLTRCRTDPKLLIYLNILADQIHSSRSQTRLVLPVVRCKILAGFMKMNIKHKLYEICYKGMNAFILKYILAHQEKLKTPVKIKSKILRRNELKIDSLLLKYTFIEVQ